jgi:NADH-quinone oxidoreductase subunit N
VIHKPPIDWLALSPELVLLGVAGAILLAAVLAPKGIRKQLSAVLCGLGYAGAFSAAVVLYTRSANGHGAIADAIFRDRFGAVAQLIVAGAGFIAVLIAYNERTRNEFVAESYALLAAAGGGMLFFVTAGNLMTMFLSLEWFSICLYVMCAIDVDVEGSLEAGLKYLIIGGFGSAILLFGSALVYGATGEIGFSEIARATAAGGYSDDAMLVIGLAMIITGLGFKASAAPFHMWTPDAYEGAPTPVTAFMSAATKAAALVVTLRILVTAFPQDEHLWSVALAAIACISLAVGNLAALAQRNVKRLLAYSSISHAGFMLIPIAAANEFGGRALLYYLIPYCAMSLGAFAVVAARERELGAPVTLDNLAGFGWERPFFGVAMATFMFGFAGLPPGGAFWGKFLAFAAAYKHGWTWLIVVGVAATAVSLYYYLAVIRSMFFRSAAELQLAPIGGSPPRELALGVAVFLSLLVTVGSFVLVSPLTGLAKHAARSLPF